MEEENASYALHATTQPYTHATSRLPYNLSQILIINPSSYEQPERRDGMAAPAPPVVTGGGCVAPMKKSPTALAATDVCAEKRMKGSCWERSEDEHVRAIREMRRESSLRHSLPWSTESASS
jgi:hypothetical protein